MRGCALGRRLSLRAGAWPDQPESLRSSSPLLVMPVNLIGAGSFLLRAPKKALTFVQGEALGRCMPLKALTITANRQMAWPWPDVEKRYSGQAPLCGS